MAHKCKFELTDWEGETGFARKHLRDTEHERTAVKKKESGYHHYNKPQVAQPDANSLGFLDRVNDIGTNDVIERAMKDKLKEAEKELAEEQAVLDAPKKDKDREGREDEDKVAKGDEDDELERLRAARRKKMMDQHKKKQEYEAKGHGDYSEIPEEDFLKTVTSSYRAVVHFYHTGFERCKVMDMHLSKLVKSKRMLGTKFCKMDAEKAPFFVSKLKIQTLPTVVFFIDGVAVHKQIGFQDLPGQDEFKTADLIRVMREVDLFEEDVDSEAEFNMY